MTVTTPIDQLLLLDPALPAPTEWTALLDRLVEMQKYIQDYTDAVPVALYSQEAPSYWTNRVDNVDQELESEQMVDVTFSINMRFVASYNTQDYEMAAEKAVALILPKILYFFSARRLLMRTQTDVPVRYLRPEGAVITDAQVSYGAQNTGIGASQFVIDFTLEVPMYYLSDQAVF